MSAVFKIMRTEARRSPGLLLFPFLATLVGYFTVETLPQGIWLWPQTSVAIRETLLVVGPLAAGLSAWVASRNRRQAVGELLATTPRSAILRELVTWVTIVAWCVLAYTLSAGMVVLFAYLGGAWGLPILWPILLGLFALVTNSAIGFTIGYYIPSRLTAPLIAVALYIIQGFTAYNTSSSIRYFSPVVELDRSPFFGVQPNVFVEQTVWLLGIIGIALAAVALRARSNPVFSFAALVVTVVVAAIGAAMLVQLPAHLAPSQAREAVVPYTPECAEGRISVCVHPAYAKLLPNTAEAIDGLTEPLIGISGAPVRAQQSSPLDDVELKPDGTLQFSLYDAATVEDQMTTEVAAALVQESSSSYEGGKARLVPGDAQSVVAGWLLKRTGRDPLGLTGGDPEATTALERFANLTPEHQSAWLNDNYAELRSGDITLEDLP